MLFSSVNLLSSAVFQLLSFVSQSGLIVVKAADKGVRFIVSDVSEDAIRLRKGIVLRISSP